MDKIIDFKDGTKLRAATLSGGMAVSMILGSIAISSGLSMSQVRELRDFLTDAIEAGE